MSALDLLAVMAHPDDAELLCGGTLLKSADRGERVGVLDLTDGEMGSKGSVETRRREAERAAEVLGLAVRRRAGLPDSALRNTLEARQRVAGIFRALRPRVVVTHWLEGRHPDHREAAQLTYDAAFLSGLKNFDADGAPHRPEKIVHAIAFREDAPHPSLVVDITATIDRKLEALACFESQFEGAVSAGEVFPGGSRPFAEQVRVHAARSGSLIRVGYGEPFWMREPLSTESLGELSVSTF